jgi:hypothetical protein
METKKMENTIYYFEERKPENTDVLLDLVKKRTQETGVKHVVVASTRGETGVKAAETFKGTDVQVVVVTHQAGLHEPGRIELTDENQKKLEELGAKIVTCTHAFGGIARSLARRPPRTPGEPRPPPSATPAHVPPIGELIARVLRLFSQGMKVCFEIAVMAADAGAIPMDNQIVAIGGTGRGADTALLMKPAHSSNFFDIDAHEIIAKPYSKRRPPRR